MSEAPINQFNIVIYLAKTILITFDIFGKRFDDVLKIYRRMLLT